MKKGIITSIDIGSSFVRCVVAQGRDELGQIRVIGVGTVPSVGLRRGSVVDVSDVAQTILTAVEQAEEMSGERITSALVSLGGADITIKEASGVVAVGRADGEVGEDDVMRAVEAAQQFPTGANHDVVHVIPQSFRLDDQENIADPVGLKGVRLEVKAHIIEAPSVHVKNITSAMERAGIGIEDFIVEPLAASEAVLGKRQKELGVALVVLGASTTSIAVFEEGDLLHTAIIPIGSDFITHDMAIGMRTSVDLSEEVKIAYGSAIYGTIKRTDEIDLSSFDSHEEGAVLHDHVIEIIIARLEEIFGLVREELVAIGKDQLLPAGAVLTGGGANMPHIVDFAKKSLELPVTIGQTDNIFGATDRIDDPSFSTVVGLILWHDAYESDMAVSGGGSFIKGISQGVGSAFGGAKDLLNRFLP